MKKKHIIRFTLYVATHCEMLRNGTAKLFKDPFSDSCGIDYSKYLEDEEVIRDFSYALKYYLEAFILDKEMEYEGINRNSKLYSMLQYMDTWDNNLLEPIERYFDELLNIYSNDIPVGEC